MVHTKRLIALTVVVCSLLWAITSHAASIPGTAGVTTLQDGPNAEGLYFLITINYQAFDGLDASDPLGVTPGKTQYAYIMSYVDGTDYVGRFDVESTNGVPLIDVATSTNGTVNGVTPGTDAPEATGLVTYADGNPAARFLYTDLGEAYFGLDGDSSVIMVYTASNTYSVGNVLGQITDSSLSAAGEVVGPIQCLGAIQGNIFCLNCGSTGQIAPMDGITVNVLQDGNTVASAVSGATGQYQISGLVTGHYTVAVASDSNYAPCSVSSMDVNIICNGTATANFCVCPQVCGQQICVQTVCDNNSVVAPTPFTWLGICGPNIVNWCATGPDGTKCYSGNKIVPGHYKVTVVAPMGYQITGDTSEEFDLAQCETKQLVFNVCPIPPCKQTICVSVVVAGNNNTTTPLPNVPVHVRCDVPDIKNGQTGADGTVCFNLQPGSHTASIDVPNGYRCNGSNIVTFALARCESNEAQFTLSKIPLVPCPKSCNYWKCNPGKWQCSTMWVGSCQLNQTQLMNILNGRQPNGMSASCSDLSITLAQNLIAAKLSIAAGSDAEDIETSVIAADEFLLYDNPPGSMPRGSNADLARNLNNNLYNYVQNCTYCQQ